MMTKNDKELLYNLLKTAASGVYGYTPDKFKQTTPEFTDDYVKAEINLPSSHSEKTETVENKAAENKTTENITPIEPQKKTVSISSISEKINSCTRCRLSSHKNNAVPGTGVDHPLVLVIGDCPGYEEDQQALPFAGAAGELLDKMLASISLSKKQNCFITNVMKCSTTQNREPQQDEIAACISYLDAQISVLKPKMILLMGRIAGQTVFRTNSSINSFRGEIRQYNGIPAMATYNPNALLKNTELKAPAWADLKKFRSELEKIAPDYQSLFVKE